jgi:hypothetical protein
VLVVPTERIDTSTSPASELIACSVFKSAIPARTILWANRVRKPSAACPSRTRPGQILQAGQHHQPLAVALGQDGEEPGQLGDCGRQPLHRSCEVDGRVAETSGQVDGKARPDAEVHGPGLPLLLEGWQVGDGVLGPPGGQGGGLRGVGAGSAGFDHGRFDLGPAGGERPAGVVADTVDVGHAVADRGQGAPRSQVRFARSSAW